MQKIHSAALSLFVALLAVSATAADDDILIADFEQTTYGEWNVEGEAFGTGPAAGTLAGQMNVSGFRGERLVNSFFEGDGTVGTLTSPPLKILRNYVTFLIGGGGHEGTTCMNLVLDGKIVRTATGSNSDPGGSETLDLQFWDVRDLKGRTVNFQIVDRARGGWGHINVDHIVQTNEKPKVPEYQRLAKQIVVDSKFLIIPIKNGAKHTELTLEVDGTPVRRYGTELATDPSDVDWYAFFTIESYQGQPAQIKVDRGTKEAFALVRQANHVPGSEAWYTEALRPQFHFSQVVGWNNDPNGMVYLDGEWHLFFQHNPVGWNWGNMTWGHAVSTDLVHWRQLPNALFPETMARGACFSGGATVDKKNTAGWKKGDNHVLVAFLTDTGAGEAVAYSNDHGRTFTWYEGNPVIRHEGRDPKVIWYAYDKNDRPLDEAAQRLGGHWVMAVYDEHEVHKQNIAFYTSTNLKNWQKQSHLTGYFECPELFELPVDGDRARSRWVVLAADARYTLGEFDGKTFTPAHEKKYQVHYGPYYASQTFDNAPDGRRIQIGWVRLAMPGMPFNQTFSFPHQLTLRSTDEGVRLFAKPMAEIQNLHKKKQMVSGQELLAGSPLCVKVGGGLLDLRAVFELGEAERVGLDIGGNRVTYNAADQELHGAPLKPQGGKISMQVLVDRPLLEICGNDGAVFITAGRSQLGDVAEVSVFTEGQGAKLLKLEVYQLQSIWDKRR